MGDWLRRLLYPLVLPIIVAAVWLSAWVRQEDDRAQSGGMALPPVQIAAEAKWGWASPDEDDEGVDAGSVAAAPTDAIDGP
jgi:hypothetical protein